jgi:acetyl esterase
LNDAKDFTRMNTIHPLSPEPVLDPHSRDLLLRVGELTTAVAAGALTPPMRRQISRAANALLVPADAVPVRREDVRIDLPQRSLPARLYRPETDAPSTAAADVLLVFFHGGGWVVGDLETHDNACAFLTQHLGCTLLSVEYRKAPEHPFPAPCDDAADGFAWAASRLASWGCGRIAVAGDSSGGHLAAHAMFANPDVPTAAALLFYPVADMDFANTSHSRTGAGPGLTSAGMVWYWEQLLGSAQPVSDSRAVLMRQQWGRRPPPTVVSLAWHDPLYDEGAAYAGLLQAGGADVHVFDARDMAHGFLRQCRINAAARGHVQAVADALLDCLATRQD